MKYPLKHQLIILLALITLTISCDPDPDPVEPEINWEEVLPGHYIGKLEVKTDLNNRKSLQVHCIGNPCYLERAKWDSFYNIAISLDLTKTNSGYEIVLEKNQVLQWETIKLIDNPPPAPGTEGYDPYENYLYANIDGIPDLLLGGVIAQYKNNSISLGFSLMYFMPSDSAQMVTFEGARPL